MLTPPTDLSDASLKGVIEHGWGIAVASLEYHPVGFGSHHWIATDHHGLRHFVTVDKLNPESLIGDEVSALGLHIRRALAATSDLRAFGCKFVVAPIATRAEEPFVQFASYSVALFPFIEWQSFSFEDSFGEAGRRRVLEMVVALHHVPIAALRPPATDEFTIPWLDQLDRSMRRETRNTGPHAAIASQLLIDNEAEIKGWIDHYQALVARYQSHPDPVVVTHGEIHPANVMVTSKGWVIVDWDTILLAPAERDLWRLAQEDGSVLRAYADATGAAPKE